MLGHKSTWSGRQRRRRRFNQRERMRRQSKSIAPASVGTPIEDLIQLAEHTRKAGHATFGAFNLIVLVVATTIALWIAAIFLAKLALAQ